MSILNALKSKKVIALFACLGSIGLLALICPFNVFSDPLTRAHQQELTTVLNNYWEVVDRENYRLHYNPLRKYTISPDREAKAACEEIAVDTGLTVCLEQVGSYDIGDSKKVVTKMRVLQYQSDCAVVAAIFKSAFQTNGAFILRKADGVWKVADRWAPAVGYYAGESEIVHNMFAERNPPLRFSCE